MSKLIQLLLLLVALFAYAEAAPNRRMSMQACGQELGNVLWGICENGFNSRIPQKRAGSAISPANADDALDLFDYVEQQNSDDDWLQSYGDSHKNYNSIVATRRHLRGIVDECCRKNCTYSELAAYCRSSRK